MCVHGCGHAPGKDKYDDSTTDMEYPYCKGHIL